ncbi:hypothetical protein [Edaphobacter modestus]|uniref:hypothetical protein n=1 Tax=Edaphobacter modestus TaxID=388466 RepID=UPI00102CE6B7|nr:hypothetical protein [Edaphobacter modestus]
MVLPPNAVVYAGWSRFVPVFFGVWFVLFWWGWLWPRLLATMKRPRDGYMASEAKGTRAAVAIREKY